MWRIFCRCLPRSARCWWGERKNTAQLRATCVTKPRGVCPMFRRHWIIAGVPVPDGVCDIELHAGLAGGWRRAGLDVAGGAMRGKAYR